MRSQLRFVQRIEQLSETDGEDERIAQVYRHSDGDPASVLRDLAQAARLLDATRAERGPAYTAATFVSIQPEVNSVNQRQNVESASVDDMPVDIDTT